VRLSYEQVPSPSGRVETRPCARIAFDADPDRVPYLALIDSGSLHTIAPLSAFEGIGLGDPEATISELCFARWNLDDVPVYRMSMHIVAPTPWGDIPLPECPVVVADAELPFVVLGSSVLTHVVVLLRDAEQLVHIKPLAAFQEAKHCVDERF
jgi:hypothetical protein